jgi:hypothetical protein
MNMNIAFSPMHLQIKNYFVKVLSLSVIAMLFSVEAFAACPSATISYSGSPFCTSLASKRVTLAGTAGGVYSSTAGLSINSSTGAITPASSTPGSYVVTYTIAAAGICPQYTTTATVAITAMPIATISYSSSSFCNSVSTPQTATVTGTSGGLFSSTTGLSINSTTGAIIPSTSTVGTYTVTYTIAASGGCAAVKATTSVTIGAAPNQSTSISYSGSPFCTSISARSVTLSGTAGGVYSSTAGLSINSTSGAIFPSASTGGTYTVTYTIAAANGCTQVVATTPVTITALPTASISYSGTPFCNSLSAPQAVTLAGTNASGGVYSSTAGLSINASTGAITPLTSTAGTYTVKYAIAASGGCAAVTATTSVTINAAPNPSTSISYSGNPFCTSISAQSVTLSGTAGGVYSSTAGLTLNSTSGAIFPSSSTGGTYTVTYTTAANGCTQVVKTTSVTITPLPTATISYSGAPFCNSLTSPQSVTLTGTSGGVYSSTAGLSLNASTGAITPSTSTPATYTIKYTIAASGGCTAVSTTTSVTIGTAADPSTAISYAGNPFCTSVSARSVTFTGTTGGVYSSTTGLTINSSSGAIFPSTSTAGNYTVTYTTTAANGCPQFVATTPITITASPTASVLYSGTPFCNSLTTPQAITLTGTTGGVYSSAAPGLTLNASTGDITPSTSTPGTYTVKYTIAANGGCAAISTTTSVKISAAPNPSTTISYVGNSFCTSATSQPVTLTGTNGGIFSSAAGLILNSSTGLITPSSSTAGTYTVTYTIAAANGCPQFVTTTPITITTLPTASISYSSTPFCNSLTTSQAVTLTGTSGGVYSSTAGLILDASTGDITPSTSTPGAYTVTYTIAASGGCAAVSATTSITITAGPDPSTTISYAENPFCTSATSQSVTLAGTNGGVFSSTAGLTLNSSTGLITPSTSTAGTYTITYTIAAANGCSQFVTTTPVTITTLPTASISYSGTPFCSSLATPQSVTLTGTSGGVYSSTAGLTLDASTGDITPSTSTAGTYTVTYTVAANGGCSAVPATTSVTITSAPSASIAYSGSPFCKSVSGTETVSFTGTLGGTFTSTSGLTIDPTNGTITPSASTVGTYTVTYTLGAANGCSSSSYTTSVEIIGVPVVSSIATDPAGYCPGDEGISFTVVSANTDSYVWTVPASLTVTSGDNTAAIVVDFESDYAGGSISVAATNVCGTTTVNATTIVSTNCNSVWNGSLSNVWGVAGNWTPSRVPGNITPVSIPAGTTYSPTLNNSNKSVGKITIDAGATLTLSGSSILSVYDDFTNNGSIVQSPTTTLLFTSSGNQSISGNLNALKNVQIATTGTASLQNNWTLAGAIRFVNGTFNINGKSFIWNFDAGARVDFVTGDVGVVSGSITLDKTMPQFTHYIASPLSGVNGSQLVDNVVVVQGATSRLYAWNFGTQTWVKQLTPSAVSFEPSQGARMYFPDAAGDLIDFTGTYNHTASYTTSAQSNAAAGKFILAGNPYPSVLDWEAPAGWAFNNVDATIYYWSQSQGTIATYTRVTGASTNGGARYIPIMQSFFVTTTGSGGTASLGIANNTRTAQTATMYRTATPDNILSISVKGVGSNTSDETVIYLSDDATDGFDSGLDAYKMKNDSIAPNLYTKLNDVEYAVNAVSSTDRTIPLSLTVPADGSYLLTVPTNANADIVLIDKQARKQKTVDGTPYSFSASTSDASDRFELQMRSAASSNTNSSASAQSISFASNGSSVVLIAKNDMGASIITIYNTLGVEVAKVSGINVSSGSNILNGIELQGGSYVVKVQNNDNQYTGHVTLVR